ncbi:hypothetical protein ACTOJ1_001207 [Shigella flexneri]
MQIDCDFKSIKKIMTIEENTSNNRLDLIAKVRSLLSENGANFFNDNLQCIIVHPQVIINSSDIFFNFLTKREYLYEFKNGILTIYKNTSQDIKKEIKGYIEEYIFNGVVSEDLLSSKEITWIDILKYCKKMSCTCFTN